MIAACRERAYARRGHFPEGLNPGQNYSVVAVGPDRARIEGVSDRPEDDFVEHTTKKWVLHCFGAEVAKEVWRGK